jgi:outer membrane usher protein
MWTLRAAGRRRQAPHAALAVRDAARFAAIWFLVLALVLAAPARGAELPRSTAPDATLFVQIVLNGEVKGTHLVVFVAADVFVRAADLNAMGIGHLRGRTQAIDGEMHVALASIDGVTVAFDERMLSLAIQVDPRLLPRQVLDLTDGRKRNVYYPTDNSAFFNYNVDYLGGNGGHDQVVVANELGARVGDFLFLTDSVYNGSSPQRRLVRLMTSVTHDNRATLERAIAGDFVAASGDLGGSALLGGVSYSKLYSLDPYLIRYPQLGIAGLVSVPSTIDVYVDGQRINTVRVAPGEFDLRNITQSIGARGVDLVIRDAFGREQRISTTYYSTDVPLKAGLQEWSYNAGALREAFGTESDHYGPFAFSAFHRIGITDALTLGMRGEGRRGAYNAGPTATMVLGPFGVTSASAAFSQRDGRGGAAALVNYAYLGQHISAGVLLRADGRNYATLADSVIERRKYEATAAIGYVDTCWGAVSGAYSTFTPYDGPVRKTVALNYGRPLFDGRASFFANVADSRAKERTRNVLIGLIYNFDADYAVSTRYDRFGERRGEVIQLQKTLPIGEGLGYTVTLERSRIAEDTMTVFSPSLQYNARWGAVRADLSQQRDATGSHRSYALSAAGGIAMVGDVISVGRPVTDSFGLVKVDDLPGVRVLVNNQAIGTTDASGKLFLPTLTSFYENQVSIDVASVPLDYSFPESLRIVSPGARAGALIDFHARRLSAVTGTLKIRSRGQVKVAEFYEVSVAVGGKRVTFVTGRGGEYYVEDLPPGRYAARIAGAGTSCAFELSIPLTREPLTELPTVICEMGG